MKKLIEKYLTNTISSSEMMDLSNWLRKDENKEIFKAYILQYYDLNYALQDVDVENEYTTLMKSIRKQKNSYKRWYKWAAIFVGVVGLSSLFLLNTSNEVVTEDNEITLKLENGDVKIIRENNNEKIVNKEGTIVGVYQDDKLEYKNTKVNDKELVYNEVSIPYGKKLQLVLSDGSMVHLNAGSSLKYPVKFLKGKDRKVFLSGEAYFAIAKDKQHPFIVNTQDVNVQALGTKFNVNSYREDNEMNTVLVEGSVGVYKVDEKFDANTSTVLQPGYKFTLNKSQQSINVKEVDVSEYTAWTKGELLFKMKPFSEIIKILERNYDVVITNNYSSLNEKRFLAKFDTETIEQVLISFQSSEEFSFTIEENRITINKR
ncbi:MULTISPECIES: FecR family protein [Aquimarina]|uniref:FecR family protein n=1 Tax=Aquimarina TaxID=290174 RepID=UPI000943C256|nr:MULTISPECIES: FecR domain-containing protein [Aquimarina]